MPTPNGGLFLAGSGSIKGFSKSPPLIIAVGPDLPARGIGIAFEGLLEEEEEDPKVDVDLLLAPKSEVGA